MAKKQMNLETELTAKIDDLTAKLNRASGQITSFKNKAKSGNSDLFSGAVSSLKGLMPVIGLAAVATTTFNGVINTTQAAGDSWALTMAGVQGALEGVYRTIGTGDWSNLFDNMVKSAAAAKDLTAALDELFEKGLSADLNNAQLDFEIATAEQLRDIAKANKNFPEVIKQANIIAALELKKITNSLKVAEDTKTAFFNDIKTITGLSDKDVLTFLKSYNDSEITKIREQATAYQAGLENIEKYKNNEYILGVDPVKVEEATAKLTSELNKQYNNEVVIYAATLKAYNSLNDEKITSAVNSEKKIIELQTASLKQIKANEVAKAKALNKEDDFGRKVDLKINASVNLKIDPEQFISELDKATDQYQKLIDEAIDADSLELIYKGLPKLEDDLAELQRLQGLSSSPELFKSYGVAIDETILKIQKFKGETKDSAISLGDFYSGMGLAFDSLADSAERFGSKGAAAFLNIVSATAQTIESVGKLIEVFKTMAAMKQLADAADIAGSIEKAKAIDATVTASTNLTGVLQTMAATKQAANAADIASAPAKIAANQGVAMSEGVAASAGVPFPGNLLAIAATIAAVVSAFAAFGKFENGGIVGGSSFTGDNITARVNSREMILNERQQANLFAMANGSGGSGGSGGAVLIKFENGSLEGYLNHRNKRTNNMK